MHGLLLEVRFPAIVHVHMLLLTQGQLLVIPGDPLWALVPGTCTSQGRKLESSPLVSQSRDLAHPPTWQEAPLGASEILTPPGSFSGG